jgi:hypothetical protein
MAQEKIGGEGATAVHYGMQRQVPKLRKKLYGERGFG